MEKTMLKSEKFDVNSFSAKTAEIAGISLRDCIKTVVRYKELSVAENKKSFVDGKNAIESAHIGVNAMDCEESIVNDVYIIRIKLSNLRRSIKKLDDIKKGKGYKLAEIPSNYEKYDEYSDF